MEDNDLDHEEPKESSTISEPESVDSGTDTEHPEPEAVEAEVSLDDGSSESEDADNGATETESGEEPEPDSDPAGLAPEPEDSETKSDKPATSTEVDADDKPAEVSSPEDKPAEAESTPVPTVTVSTDDIKPTEPVVSSRETTSDQPPSRPVVSSGPKMKSKGLFVVLAVLIIVALGVGGYLMLKPAKSTPESTVVVKKDIPDLKVDIIGQGSSATYYPNIVDESNVVAINMQMFEGLTKFEDGNTIVPDLALSWTNPNSSTWIFKLRPNVKFHTGRTMTATDVKASIEAVQSSIWGQEFASTIKSVEVIDPLTVEIDTNGPDPLMLNELTRLYVYDTTSGKTDDPINGTGPYTLASVTPNDITLTAVNNYWGGHVYTRKIEFLGYQTGESIPTSLLKSNQLQVMTIPNDPTFAASLKAYGYQTSESPNYAVGQLVFDTRATGKPWANVAVRKAMAEAIDKPALITASSNTGSPAANQTIPAGIPGYDPTIPAVTYSVTKAKADLTAAGYPNGFSIGFSYYEEPPVQALANEFQKEMAAIGVTVVLNPISDETAYGNIVENGGGDMYYDVVSSDYVDGSDILSFFVDSAYYSNPSLDALSTQASQTLDATKRVKLLQEMNDLVETDQANIPLFQRETQVLAVAPHIVIIPDTYAVQSMNTYFYHDYEN